MNKFESSFVSTLNNETILSENGANMFLTSGSKLVDIHFAISSLRNASSDVIQNMFAKAFYENELLATKWLFMCRDIRGGCGERRLFRICLSWLSNIRPNLVKKLISICSNYGRFDDLFYSGLEGETWDSVVDYVANQFKNDLESEHPSLLAKWMPSPNTSSPKTRALARKLRRSLGIDERTYRKNLSALRAKLRLVEVNASAGNWNEIDYNAVPSQANLKYKNAFLKHDEVRRRQYLADLEKPESGAKINASASFPCDIVAKYVSGSNTWNPAPIKKDQALEAMWNALPDYVAGNNDGSTIVVCDTSGSMTSRVSGSSMTALDVAHSLAIYFAEKLTGPFKDKFISFSGCPKYIDMSNCRSLADKLTVAYGAAEVSNTDLMKTFMLILKTAVDNKLTQDDLPSNVLIVSDMNFDAGTYCYSHYNASQCSLMKEIADRFAEHGYRMPRCVYWNVIGGCDRKAPLPVQADSSGTVLISGFSPAIAGMVFSAKTNPYDVLVEALSKPRYQPIEDAFNSVEL